MREEFKASEARDFRARYEGTYGWYELENGKETLVKLTAITDHALSFTDESGFVYTAIPDKGNVFRFLPVERGVYNTADDVVFCERIPARQWHRGMCAANTALGSLVTSKTIPLSFDILKKLFHPKPDAKTIKDAFIKDLTGAAALNHVFSIVGNNVWCYDIKIGDYKKGLVTLRDKLFVQELNDIMRDQHLPITVEVKNG